MTFFFYSFLSNDGKIARRFGSFESLEELYNKAEAQGNSIYNAVVLPSWFEAIYKIFVIGKAKLGEISEFVRNLSTYISGGLSIQDAIEDLNKTSSRALKNASKIVMDALNEGYSISEAFSKAAIFPDMVISMAKIGEKSGNIDKTLADAADYLDRIIEIKSSTKRALIYPGFSLVSILGAFIFWTVFVLPKITSLFVSERIALPLATRMLIKISTVMQNYWWEIIVFAVAFVMIFPFLLKIERLRLLFDKALWKMPIIGLIIRNSQTAFYFQYLSLLTSSGVSLTESLRTMEFAVSNKFFLKSIKNITVDLEGGQSIAEATKNTTVFEPLAVRMISVAEKTGNFDTNLNKLAQIYYGKVEKMVEVIGKLIEPIILIFIGILFVFFVMALIGPIYSMLGNMTR